MNPFELPEIVAKIVYLSEMMFEILYSSSLDGRP